MEQPIITYSLNWGNNASQKLSGKTFVNPSGQTIDCSKVTVTFSSSLYIEKFYATAVKEGNDYGFINDELVDIREKNPTGVKLHELTKRDANVNFSFDIKASSLLAGNGIYRIGLYTQQIDGTWNYEYFLLASDQSVLQTKDGENIQVPTIK